MSKNQAKIDHHLPEPPPPPLPEKSALELVLGPLIIMPGPGGLYATSVADFETNAPPNWRKVGQG